MKLITDPRLPTETQQLVLKLTNILRDVTNQLNNLTEGRISAVYNAQPAPPASGQNYAGDFVRNSAPSELGTAGSRFIVFGWMCVASGTPGTWSPLRTLTGN